MARTPAAGAARPWYAAFFDGLALELWRQAVPRSATTAEAAAIPRWLGVRAGARLLDLPCGNGRLSLPLARRRFRLTGIDQSAAFVAEARAAAAEAGLDATFLRADMREIPDAAPFDGAFCFGNSFGYLDAAGTEAFAGALAAALRPGARFLLHTAMAAESVLPAIADRIWHPVGDMLMLVENSYDAVESRLDSVYTFVRDGSTETRHAVHWIFTVGEIRRLFARHGLDTVAVHGDLSGGPFTVGDDNLYLVFERR